MSDFEAEFRANPDPARNWPGAVQAGQLAEDFNLFSRVLFEPASSHRRASEIAVDGGDADLRARLVDFLDGYQNPDGNPSRGWPKQDATIPASAGQPEIAHRTVRLWEAAVVLQSLLGGVAIAMREQDGGGTPTKWPPHMSF